MADFKLKPLGGNVVVKGIEKDQATESGIIIASVGEKEKPQRGEVVAVGPKVNNEINVGNIVYFKRYSPDEFSVDKETYLVMPLDAVIAFEEK